MIPMHRARILIEEILGPENCNEWREGEREISCVFSAGMTFAAMTKISEALGTESLDLSAYVPAHEYSSVTYDSSIPSRLRVRWPE